MRASLTVAAAAFVVACSAPAAFADVQLSLHNGRVTLVAKDATVRQILTEWARVGQTKIVNVERVPGGPVTLELRDVSEQQALRVLLRSLGGYVTAPRPAMLADASVFDRIVVMPVTAPPPSANSPVAAPPAAYTQFQPPQMQPPLDDRDDSVPSPLPQPAGNRGPVFVFPPPTGGGQQQPQPQQQPQQQPTLNPPGMPVRPAAMPFPGASSTSAPVGVSVPGMPVPVPAPPPGSPGAPVQPGQQPGLPALQPQRQP